MRRRGRRSGWSSGSDSAASPRAGVVPAALIGGVGAIAVVFIWMRAFPEIARIDKLNVEEERR